LFVWDDFTKRAQTGAYNQSKKQKTIPPCYQPLN
jgi:hypothetical protein